LSQWLDLAGFTSPALMTDSSWIAAMNKLGALIRAAEKGGA
jgi:hypothetical protein